MAKAKSNEAIDASRRALIRTALYSPPLALGLVSCEASGAGSTEQDEVSDDVPAHHTISNQFGAGANMPAGTEALYTDPGLPNHTLIVVKGADNQATRLSGIDVTGVSPGDVKFLLNWSESGQDCGQVVLKHKSPDADPVTQIVCPGDDDYYIPINGGVILVYGGIAIGDPASPTTTYQWHVVDAGGWGKRAKVQSLNFYPNIELPMLAGSYDNAFNIGGYTSLYSPGLAGGDMDLKSYTVVRIPVDPAGAVLTGLAPDSGTNGDESALGPVKILMNYGPGRLTLKHLTSGAGFGDGVTLPNHQFMLPRAQDLLLDQFESVMLVSTLGDPNPDSLWHVISIGKTDLLQDQVTCASTLTTKSEILSPFAAPEILPGIAAGVIHDWDPGDTDAIIRVTTDDSGSLLGGLVGQPNNPRGERRLLVVVGSGPLILVNEDPESVNANRIDLPANVPFIVPSRAAVWLTKDATDHWKLDAQVGVAQALQIDITPDAMPAGNVDDWDPVGAFSLNIGLDFQYANWIRAQGAAGGSTLRSLMPTVHGRRILLTNYATPLTIAYGVSTAGGGSPFVGGGTSFTLATFGSVWLTYDGLNELWLVGT